MSILQAKEMSDTIKKFIETVDNHFIKPKKEEYYNLVRHFKYCKQGIKDINFRKKIRRKSIKDWLWTWVLYFCKQPKSAFYVLMNTKRDSESFVNDYWILKNNISKIDQCINELEMFLTSLKLFQFEYEHYKKERT
jgi:hypothetical protein